MEQMMINDDCMVCPSKSDVTINCKQFLVMSICRTNIQKTVVPIWPMKSQLGQTQFTNLWRDLQLIHVLVQ